MTAENTTSEIKTEKNGTGGPVYSCTNLNVCLGDGSEEMVYTGQLMLYDARSSSEDKANAGHLGSFLERTEKAKGREFKRYYDKRLRRQRSRGVKSNVDPSCFSSQSATVSALQGKLSTTEVPPVLSSPSLPTASTNHETGATISATASPKLSFVPGSSKPFSESVPLHPFHSFTSAVLQPTQPMFTSPFTTPISSTTEDDASSQSFNINIVANGDTQGATADVASVSKSGKASKPTWQCSNVGEDSQDPTMSTETSKDPCQESAPGYEAGEESGFAQASTSQRCTELARTSKHPVSPTMETPLGGKCNAMFNEKSVVNIKKTTSEDANYKNEVSADSGFDTAASCSKNFMRNDEKTHYPSTTNFTSMELRQKLHQAKQYCYGIQGSLIKSLFNELRKLEANLKLEQSVGSSKESVTSLHKSLVVLLDASLKCLDIQVGLNHGLKVVLDETSDDIADHDQCCDSSDEDFSLSQEDLHDHSELESKDDQLIESRSLMNRTSFVQSLVCVHLANPYSADLRYTCGADRIYSRKLRSVIHYLPHGKGRLESLSGNLIFEGQWKKGKRWGFGKAFIFCGHELSASKTQYGTYQGYWWTNMRHGRGRLVLASSAEYNGEWQYDLMSGVGTMKYSDGSSLEGIWDENEPHGCGMFTWPNGTVECREYAKGQVLRVLQLPENPRKISSYNNNARDYSILRLKYQTVYEERAVLLQSNSRLKNALEKRTLESSTSQSQLEDTQEKYKTLKTMYENKKVVAEQLGREVTILKESSESKIKELEVAVCQVQKELDSKKTSFLCQICYDRERDCIIMPCTHLLYCRECICKVKNDSQRCPACRGTINGEIYCNINR